MLDGRLVYNNLYREMMLTVHPRVSSIHTQYDHTTKGFSVYPRLLSITSTVVLIIISQHCVAQDAKKFAKDSGIDRSVFSDTIAPGENFYEYANQKWLTSTEIPSDKSDYGVFTILNDETQEQVRELIETAAKSEPEPGTPAQKVGDLYRSVLDIHTRNEAGIEPLRFLLDEIDAIDSAKIAGENHGEAHSLRRPWSFRGVCGCRCEGQ